ncbi:MAG: site-2 protease family protein, partial [Spirochaetales bacterium]|nr:site-2 protease family protein [Spirochaetales bacterium]
RIMIILVIFFGLLGLGIIILIHELGHFIVAKLCGIKVETFSIGWGKKLTGFKYKDTTYQVAVFPIGGYCKMKGEYFKEEMTEESFQKAMSEPDTFMAASWWKKILVSVGGPLANLLFAFIVFSIIWMAGFRVNSTDTRVLIYPEYFNSIYEPGAGPKSLPRELPTVKAGLKTGDVITAVNGKPVTNFYEVSRAIERTTGPYVIIRIMRGTEVMEKNVAFQRRPDSGRKYVGIIAWVDPLVDEDSPSTGLKKGDKLLAITGKTYWVAGRLVYNPYYAAVNAAADLDVAIAFRKPIGVKTALSSFNLMVLRDGKKIPVLVKCRYNEENKLDLSISYAHTLYNSPSLGFGGSIAEGFYEVTQLLELTFRGLAELFSFRINLTDAVAGPIRITQMVGEITILGFSLGFGDGVIAFFRFLCILCVLISIMNMLPIPALDGGQVVLSVIMAVKKRKISKNFLYRYQVIGFSIIVLLFLLGMFSDIMSFLN